MPDVKATGTDVYEVSFTEEEAVCIDKHAKQWGLSLEQAVIDLYEYATSNLDELDEVADTSSLFQDDVPPDTIRVEATYPKTGPFSVLTEDDKRFLLSVLAMSVREAGCVILYKKAQKGKDNVMERGNENDGTVEPAIS